MKLVARLLSALAILALATPALPCSEEATKQVTASSEKDKSTPVAKSSTTKKVKKAAKPAAEAKPVTASN
jgi:hypothetical protein